jgi:hypothetical protein
MMILLHVIIALCSVAYATYLVVSPAKASFGAHYTFIVLTVLSGTYLIVAASVNMLKTCTIGLLYLGFVSVMTFVAQNKLASIAARQHKDD